MNLLVNGMRAAARGVVLGALALLASCGGGDPVVEFDPVRVLAFGDENSVLTGDGHKYTVNTLVETDGVKALDCAVNGIWVQRLAAGYGLVFPECNPDEVADPPGRIYAAPDAKVAELADQVDQHLATDTFSGRDLVTMMVGQHDVLELYALYPGTAKSELLAEARERGLALADQVVRVAAAGGKVLISTVVDIGQSPFALAENESTGDDTRAQLLRDLVDKFNEGLRVGIANEDGSQVAIMLTHELVQTMVKFPSNYGLSNVTEAVCDPALAASVELCTTDTLVTDGTAFDHLWADGTHLSPAGHSRVGSLAASRTRANPF